jgi:hypothetical protein
VEHRLSERAEESAEQILARLERYVARSRAHLVATEFGNGSLAGAATTAVPIARSAPVDTLIPSHDVAPLGHSRFLAEVAPALVAVTVCSFVILLTEWFDVGVAAVVCGALLLFGGVGLVRRVPLARAYTFGLVVAALLIRLS